MGDGCEVADGEAVAGVEFEPGFLGGGSGGVDPVEFFGNLVAFGVGVCAGVQFDGVGVDFGAGSDLGLVGINEGADAYAGVVEVFDDVDEPFDLSGDVEPAFGCDFLPVFGDEADGVGFDVECDVDDFVCDAHFEVEADLEDLPEQLDVAVLDVASVLPEVDGDLVGAGHFADFCGGDDVGREPFSCLAQRSDVVDVDAEFDHVCPLANKRPRGGPVVLLGDDLLDAFGQPACERLGLSQGFVLDHDAYDGLGA